MVLSLYYCIVIIKYSMVECYFDRGFKRGTKTHNTKNSIIFNALDIILYKTEIEQLTKQIHLINNEI